MADQGVDQSAGSAASVLAGILILMGGLWYEIRLLYRLLRPFFCLSLRERESMMREWPVKRMVVPHNIVFVIHRQHEFMMLMLGETLLQLVIADNTSSSIFDYYVLSLGGFAICVCMMFSYHINAPHGTEHVLFRAGAAGVNVARRAWTVAGIFYMGVLMSFKSGCVLLVGVGIKLAAADPTAAADASFAADQRLQLGGALVAMYCMQLIMKPLHSDEGLVHYYRSMCHASCAKTRARLRVVLCRLLLCAAHLGVCYAPLMPISSVSIHAGLSVLQVALNIRAKHVDEEVTDGRGAGRQGRRYTHGHGRKGTLMHDGDLLLNCDDAGLIRNTSPIPIDIPVHIPEAHVGAGDGKQEGGQITSARVQGERRTRFLGEGALESRKAPPDEIPVHIPDAHVGDGDGKEEGDQITSARVQGERRTRFLGEGALESWKAPPVACHSLHGPSSTSTALPAAVPFPNASGGSPYPRTYDDDLSA